MSIDSSNSSIDPPAGSAETVDWSDLGREMWSFLTGRQAAINYTFEDMKVEVPRDTGASAPRATWKLDGTLRVTTTDHTTADAARKR